MKKIFITFLSAAALFLAAVEIPFTVENPGNLKGSCTIRVGIPFPKGQFQNADDFGVFDGARQIGADITVLNRWPQDQSLRWASVVFSGDLNGALHQKFTLKTGVRPQKNKAVSFKEVKFTPYFITASGVRYTAKNPEYTSVVEETPLRILNEFNTVLCIGAELALIDLVAHRLIKRGNVILNRVVNLACGNYAVKLLLDEGEVSVNEVTESAYKELIEGLNHFGN